MTVVQGTLAGFVVLVLAGVVTCVFNRLWQRSLILEAGAAIQEAESLGLELMPLGFGPAVVARGQLDGVRVWVRWEGGICGARSQLRVGERRHRLDLLVSAAALRAALSGEE